jgi:hypothetical protein
VAANLFRFNVVDASGAVSFVGPAHGLKVLAAACSRGPSTIGELFDRAERYDPEWIDAIRLGLRVFDEHNIEGLSESYASNVTNEDDSDHRAFRIVDAITRKRSNQPARLGLVVVNLREQRIIQVQNSYGELARKGRGRIREAGRPTLSMFHYELPDAWSIVP